jgi:hypothetical protein
MEAPNVNPQLHSSRGRTRELAIEQGDGVRPGALIAHFEGTTIHGGRCRYDELWQHRNLVLVLAAPPLVQRAQQYLRSLEARLSELRPDDTSLVLCDHDISQLPPNTLVIADRWGEIAHIQNLSANPAAWPPLDEIVDWVHFIQMKCPECPP